MVEKHNPKVKERKFIRECIQLYRELPSLWNVKSKEYHDRDKKKIAYEILLSKYKEMFPQASKDDVKKKFNSLRTNYRKELKKHLQSIESGSSTDDIYEPTLWYFKEMFFLQDQESASDSQSGYSYVDTQFTIDSPGEESEHSTLDNICLPNLVLSYGAFWVQLSHFEVPLWLGLVTPSVFILTFSLTQCWFREAADSWGGSVGYRVMAGLGLSMVVASLLVCAFIPYKLQPFIYGVLGGMGSSLISAQVDAVIFETYDTRLGIIRGICFAGQAVDTKTHQRRIWFTGTMQWIIIILRNYNFTIWVRNVGKVRQTITYTGKKG
ncbi:uncharacterized protein [Epargyreus clarus]|uniref:uncharacterized protein isoform X4 n=1 Tax=Epargyreus clarus TaxID=520877 RepID=UPI003C2D8699